MHWKRKIFIALGVLILLFLLDAFVQRSLFKKYHLTYQASDSMPEGLYFIRPVKKIARNEIVVFTPPPTIQDFLDRRHWLTNQSWLMKRVVGMPGDFVCLKNHELWINQSPIGPVLLEDKNHLPMPQLSFCRTLIPDEYFLMSTYIVRSFDSRYFGPVTSSLIQGEAVPLWLHSST